MTTLQTVLNATQLEDRLTPANFGVVWADAQNLTVSFAPDGTDINGAKSDLVALLDAQMGAGKWQGELTRALQSWASVANIDAHVVNDDGSAFGSPAPLQGSAKFGDIRIGARALSSNVLTISNPPDIANDWAGEIIVNSNAKFSIGGKAGTVDFYTAMLQETGHALGVANNQLGDKTSAMYEYYLGARAGLGAADIAAIQSLYGARSGDRFEGGKGNGSIKQATPIQVVSKLDQVITAISSSDATSIVIDADITTKGDLDFYSFTLPANSSSPIVQLTTSNRSLLQAKVNVYDAAGTLVLSQSAKASGGDIALDLKSLRAGNTYSIRISGLETNYAIGGYRLVVGESTLVKMAGSFTTAFRAEGYSFHVNGSGSGATLDIGGLKQLADARWDLVGTSLFTKVGVDSIFRISSGTFENGVLLVSVTGNSPVSAKLRVTDSNGKEFQAEVLRTDDYTTVLQIRGVAENTEYVIHVSASQLPFGFIPVAYQLAADFRTLPIELQKFASGTIPTGTAAVSRNLKVTQSTLFRFDLGVLANSTGTGATLTVTNANGQVVLRIAANAGQTLVSDVLLSAGDYKVSIAPNSLTGNPPGSVSIVAHMTVLSDPIGPVLVDPTAPPPLAPLATTTTTKPSTPSPEPTTVNPYAWAPITNDPLKVWW